MRFWFVLIIYPYLIVYASFERTCSMWMRALIGKYVLVHIRTMFDETTDPKL